MINQAKVNLSSVKTFRTAVLEVTECSKRFAKGIANLDGIAEALSERRTILNDAKTRVDAAVEILSNKIDEIKNDIANLTERINELEATLSSLRSELASTSPTITILDLEELPIKIPNPKYAQLLSKIGALDAQLPGLKGKLTLLRQRLDRAIKLDKELKSHCEKIQNTISEIEHKIDSCKKSRDQFEILSVNNDKNGTNAYSKLGSIESIVNEYLSTKIRYRRASVSTSIDKINMFVGNSVSQLTNASKPSDKVSNVDDNKQTNTEQQLSSEEKTIQNIQRKMRFEKTPSGNNPVNGTWEGERGDSKYCISDRTSWGVMANEILKVKYKMDGIEYVDGEPDFTKCCEARVEITNMTKNRYNYKEYIQLGSGNTKAIPKLGNFMQADIECARVWNIISYQGKNDWCAEDVENYRHTNNLEWHETCDCKTMVLVYSVIHKCATHAGGVSMCKLMEEYYGGEIDG